MKSAFHPFPIVLRLPIPRRTQETTSAESETEDEEVKLTCLGGVVDSDINSSDSSDAESDDDDASLSRDEDQTVLLEFVCERPKASKTLIHPRVSSGNRLSPQIEEDEESAEESESSSVGARGVPLGVDSESAYSQTSEDLPSSDEETTSSEVKQASSPESQESSVLEEEADDEESDASQQEISDDLSVDMGNLSCSEDCFDAQDVDEALEGKSLSEGTPDEGSNVLCRKHKLLATSLVTAESSGTDSGHDSPKRRKSEAECDCSTPLLPFSLGEPAILPSAPVPMSITRLASPSLCTINDDDRVLDGQLRDELDGYHSDFGSDKPPVPLLTPPVSPQPIPVGGDTSSMCEWPSNLVVDSAMTAVITHIQPLSPVSLAQSEDFDLSEDYQESTLSPLLRGLNCDEASY
eukprot:CAMPEP_0172474888 /NCGR_PEP_ID=MMETSP1065-20121228/69585_1 /TAXON_ID=265537 /ORGANISM="Amphiprora paludosa, Strain CCMP125" /LENGTH=407 /DNA_ID=CAMNT_0013233081 /DNA_START=1186 /DNA_END=2409 /DNA_ORIENTATION=-